MVHSIKIKDFEMEYIESEIGHPVLWERHCHAQHEMIAVADGDITVVLENLAQYTSRSKSSLCHLFASKMKISPKQAVCNKKSHPLGRHPYPVSPLDGFFFYSPGALLVSMVVIIFSMEGLPIWGAFSPRNMTRFWFLSEAIQVGSWPVLLGLPVRTKLQR